MLLTINLNLYTLLIVFTIYFYIIYTDYAVEIFHSALANELFTCGLRPDSRLPMMHIDDCIDTTVKVWCFP